MSTLLIIDDERDASRLLAKRLRAQGYKVACCFEGKDAFETVCDIKPNLILLDIWLPYLSGTEIFKQLRQNKETKQIPVIFLSADPSKEEFCLKELQCEGFIKKPYTPKELVEIIEKTVQK